MSDIAPAPSRPIEPIRATAVVVAAGRGERFGTAAKCLSPLAGRPMLAYTLDAIDAASGVDDVVIVAGEHTLDAVARLTASGDWRKPARTVLGGATRQRSVALGVEHIPAPVDVVVIHDAARPIVTPALFDRTVQTAAEFGAAIAATPVVDTIKRIADGRIAATVPREDLWAAQTPQAFRRDRLVAALESKLAREHTFTDEAGLFEALGWEVRVVAGDVTNIKVTRPGDLAIAEAILASIAAASDPTSDTRRPERVTP